jgi:hypothetical protein
MLRRAAYRVGPAIMSLIQGEQLLGPYGIGPTDTESGESPFNPIKVRIERHRLDWGAIGHRPSPSTVGTERDLPLRECVVPSQLARGGAGAVSTISNAPLLRRS